MSGFALEPVSERRLIIEQVAARCGILPVIVEKDFWVCWILGRIFQCPAMAPGVLFKGGTSLSKVFGVIQRFSEDADLSVAPAILGFSEAELDEAPSATARLRRMKALAKACEACVVRHKSRFFASSWASYGTAVPGTFHLLPAEHRHEALARDLAAMRPMFLDEPPSFMQLLAQLETAEMELNRVN